MCHWKAVPQPLQRYSYSEHGPSWKIGRSSLQGLDDAKPILQATPVSLTGRHFAPLAATMKVSAPAKRGRSGSIVGIGSFLSIASADSGGNQGNGSLAGYAHTGTRILGNVLHDLHVVGL